MFGFLFGWRPASKCKRLVKQAQCRLKLLKNKRYAIVRLLRDDVAQLLRIGDRNRALSRAEQLFRDENLMAVYDLLDHFCEFIIIHMSYIRRHREFPNDINEAVSSLVFASSRCGDLPELRDIRQLFGQRYGQRFLATALQLLPGNLVNCQIKEKLSVASVSDAVKSKLVDEIAREYCLRSEILTLEYTPEFHEQVTENDNADKERKEHMTHYSSVAQPSPRQQQHAVVHDCNEAELYKFTISEQGIEECREARTANRPEVTSQAPNQLSDETKSVMTYPEYDIEELHGPSEKDQRMFRFRPRMRGTPEHSLDELSICEKCGSGSVSFGRARKRSRRISWENVLMKDMECVVYYSKQERKKHQKRRRGEQVNPCYVVYNVYLSPNQEHTEGSDSRGMSVAKRPPDGSMKKMESEGRVKGSKSCGFKAPKHVHPKLPDYDEIAAKFMGLRRESLNHNKYIFLQH